MPQSQLPPKRAPAISTDDTVIAKSLLGRGLYGEVHACRVKGNNREYAAKIYHCQPTLDELKQIFTGKLKDVAHPNVVLYLGVCPVICDVDTQPAFVMERLVTNLATFLGASENKHLQLRQKCSILLDVANGLGYLHEKGIIHCSLTAHNVLMTGENRAKIADYVNTLVKSLAELEIPTRALCLEYLPEEARQDDYDKSVDVFAFAHLSLQVILQRRPYPLGPRTLREKGRRRPTPVSEVDRREPFMRDIHERLSGTALFPLVEHIRQCLSNEPSDRPPITDLYSLFKV